MTRPTYEENLRQKKEASASAPSAAQPKKASAASALKRIKVPIPPLEEQRRIVLILDKFDSLVNDLSIGLPAELEAWRKQYEYYRDRLLTFEEKR